ncbi:MAG: PAS domain-containing protein [Myxococcota bacterium]
MAEGPAPTVRIGVARVEPGGRCVFVNDAFAKILGFTREQILGEGWRSLVPDHSTRMPEFWDELRTGRTVESVEVYRRPDGRDCRVRLESMPEMDDDGRVVSVLLTCVDVTDDERAGAETDRERERASERLEQLEELYANTPVGLCVVDRGLRYVRANRLYAETVGYSVADLLGRRLSEVVPESAREESVELATRVIRSGEPELNVELRREIPGRPADGRIWRANVHPVVRDGQVVGAMAALLNVTELRAAEEEARRSLAELEAIYANSPVGLSLIDRELRYVRVNQAIADQNGISPEEMVGKAYRDLAPETAELAERFLHHVLENGRSVRNLEVRARPPADREHEHIYLMSLDPMRDAEGNVTGLASAVHDVTELRRAEAVAARRLEELELVYANAPVALCHLDPKLRVQHANERFAALCEGSRDACLGRSLTGILPGTVARQLVPLVAQVTRTGITSTGSQVVVPARVASGRETTWIAAIHPARRDGSVHAVILVLQDVTALVDREQELEAVCDRLEEAQRVARVGSWEWNILGDEVWWSPELYEIFGESKLYDPSSAGVFEHVHPDDRARVREQADQTVRDGAPYRLTYRIVRGDGEERVVFAVARLVRTPEGQPARLVGTCQDITEFGPPGPAAVRRRKSRPSRRRPAGQSRRGT